MPNTPFAYASQINTTRLIRETCVAAIEQHEKLGSTNDRAKEIVRGGGANLPLLITAASQTAGRGRGKNRWWTGPGSLAFSLLAEIDTAAVARRSVPLIALAAGVALVEVVRPLLSERSVGLHWPNDVYVDDRKLAGILIELPSPDRLIVGVGINTNCRSADAPEELCERVATLIDLTGDVQNHTELLIQWLTRWERWVGRLAETPEEIGRRADELCLRRGRRLCLRQGETLHEGRCLGIAADGALRLETARGERSFYSGTLQLD